MGINIEEMTNDELSKTYIKKHDLTKMGCYDREDIKYMESLEKEINERNGEISIKVRIAFPKE